MSDPEHHDPGNRLTNLAVGAHTVAYVWDGLDRIEGVAYDGMEAAYTYHSQGRQVAQVLRENGVVTTYAYDPLARLTNLVHASSGAEVLRQFAYEVDDADLRTRVTREGGWRIDYAYDPIGQLVGAQGYQADGSVRPGYQFGYGYDPAGNPLVQNRNGLVTSNAFNNLNQNVTSRWAGVLAVLGYGNTSEGSVTAGGQAGTLFNDMTFAVTNLALVSGSNVFSAVLTDPFGRAATSTVAVTVRDTGYAYDANGNLTNDGERAYAWDEENRLIEVRDIASGLPLMQSRYDGLSRRRERVQWVDGVGSTNRYVYDNWNVLRVLDGADTVVESYVHGPDLSGSIGGAGGIGGILSVAYEGEPEPWRFYHADGNGNVVLLTDETKQETAWLEYDPFGRVLIKTANQSVRYQFSSKEYDATVGLNYYGYRYYSPQMGRWVNRDPIGVKGGINVYGFSKNNSISLHDPLGLEEEGGTEGGISDIDNYIVIVWDCKGPTGTGVPGTGASLTCDDQVFGGVCTYGDESTSEPYECPCPEGSVNSTGTCVDNLFCDMQVEKSDTLGGDAIGQPKIITYWKVVSTDGPSGCDGCPVTEEE